MFAAQEFYSAPDFEAAKLHALEQAQLFADCSHVVIEPMNDPTSGTGAVLDAHDWKQLNAETYRKHGWKQLPRKL